MVTSTNSLILLLPPSLFSPTLLPLFQAHFSTYGELVLWTPLEKLGRCLVAYEEVESAVAARREMDGFVWQEEHEVEDEEEDVLHQSAGLPLRAFFGPSLSLPLAPLQETLLRVPELSRNFLISPPGSPPVGWEQSLEEAPNAQALPEDGGWADELSRALRFLSTGEGAEGVVDEEDVGEQNGVDDDGRPSTTLLIPPSSTISRTSITVSTPSHPSASQPSSCTDTPPPEAPKIGNVKATIESMLGRKRSYSDLGLGARKEATREEPPPGHLGAGGATTPGSLGGGLGMPRSTITPTARPPIASDSTSAADSQS